MYQRKLYFCVVIRNLKLKKKLHKAVKKRSQLKNKADRTKSLEDITKYKKQQNLAVKLNTESKTQYFDNIQTTKNSNYFWDNCKP